MIKVAQFRIVAPSNHSREILDVPEESRHERVFLTNYFTIIRTNSQEFDSWPNYCFDSLIKAIFRLFAIFPLFHLFALFRHGLFEISTMEKFANSVLWTV